VHRLRGKISKGRLGSNVIRLQCAVIWESGGRGEGYLGGLGKEGGEKGPQQKEDCET